MIDHAWRVIPHSNLYHPVDTDHRNEQPVQFGKTVGDHVQEWYSTFVKALGDEMLFEMLLAANYLDLSPLLELCAATVGLRAMSESSSSVLLLLSFSFSLSLVLLLLLLLLLATNLLSVRFFCVSRTSMFNSMSPLDVLSVRATMFQTTAASQHCLALTAL